jgi:hypothetical protein
MSDTPQVLLAHHLKALRLPTFLREYDKLARQCAAEGVDHSRYLLRLAELEMIERERRTVERRIKEARFPAVKSLDGAVRNFVFEPVVDERSSRHKRLLNYLQSRSGGRSQGRREPARAAREPLTACRRGGYRQSHRDAHFTPPERSGPRTGSPAGSWQRAT